MNSIDTYTYNQSQLYIFDCMSHYVDFKACFFEEIFQPMNAALTFQIGLNDCARANRGKFSLQLTWKDSTESGPSIPSTVHFLSFFFEYKEMKLTYPYKGILECVHHCPMYDMTLKK